MVVGPWHTKRFETRGVMIIIRMARLKGARILIEKTLRQFSVEIALNDNKAIAINKVIHTGDDLLKILGGQIKMLGWGRRW